VIVTPYTVKPTNRRDLALPNDNFQPASDVSANLMGRLHELYGVQGGAPDGAYQGRYGFIIK
jgi:pilus assembly protein CpaC